MRKLTLTVSGPPGEGKTKLMQRLLQFLELDGHSVTISGEYDFQRFIRRDIVGPLAEPISVTMKEETNE